MNVYDADGTRPGQDGSSAHVAGDLRRLRLPSLLATALITSAIVLSAALSRAIGG